MNTLALAKRRLCKTLQDIKAKRYTIEASRLNIYIKGLNDCWTQYGRSCKDHNYIYIGERVFCCFNMSLGIHSGKILYVVMPPADLLALGKLFVDTLFSQFKNEV